jgi:hypothetical protein
VARKSSPDSDPNAWIEDLPDDELRRLLSLGSARLRARLTSTAGHLVLKNIGKVGVTVKERGAKSQTLAPGKSESLAPQPFSTTTGDTSGTSSRWLSPRARTVLVFQLTAETAGAEVALDLTGWRADAARIGAPEVLLLSGLADSKDDGAGAHVSYLPVVTLSLDKSAPVDVIVIGRGPEDDPGRLLRGLFESPAERSGGEDEVVDDEEPRAAPKRRRAAPKKRSAAPKPKKGAER